MKKKTILAVVMALLVVTGAAFLSSCSKNTVSVGDTKQQKDVEILDLSGQPLPALEEICQLTSLKQLDLRDTGMTFYQYDELAAALPGCQIRWSVPFQGGFLDNTVETITLTQLQEEDIPVLHTYFPNLREIDGTGCAQHLELSSLADMLPECSVSYLVPLGDQMLPRDTKEIQVDSVTEYELVTALDCLPEVEKVTVTGNADKQTMTMLKTDYPQVNFEWSFDFYGQTVSSNQKEVELNKVQLSSAEELEEQMACFNALEKLVVLDSGLKSEDLDALWKRHPETRLIWNVKIGRIDIRTDATALMPYTYGYVYRDKHTRLYDKDCAEMKYLVDMVCMDFGHQWLTDISFCQYMPNLEYMLFCENGITDLTPLSHCKKLKYLEPFSNPIADISPLLECPALVDLNLSYVHIDDITPLLELPAVENLWLTKHYFTEEQQQQIIDAHPDTNIVFHSMRSTGFGWRELPNYYAQRDLLGMHYMKTSLYDPDK